MLSRRTPVIIGNIGIRDPVAAISILELSTKEKISLNRRAINELSQQALEYEARRLLTLTSPVSGTISSVQVKPGQSRNAGEHVATIIQDGARFEAYLLVPTRAIGFIKPGQSVILRFDAFPYQQFGVMRGQIADIERSLAVPDDNSVPITVQEPVYKVRVTLQSQAMKAYGMSIALRVGMLLDADIEIERKTLIHWFLNPLYSLTGKL